MNYNVILTRDAMYDFEEIISFIAKQESPAQADTFLRAIQEKIEGLKTFPDRGTYPKELLDLGIKDYREVYIYSIRMIYRSIRMIYRVIETNVYIYVVADGRRDFRSLLERRLLHD